MDIQIKAYLNKYAVQKFTSASGSIIEKEEFILTITEKEDVSNYFAMELPLSPSFGEMPQQLLKCLRDNKPLHSKAFRNCLSYFLNAKAFPHKKSPQKPLTIYTYGINQLQIINNKNSIIKIKAFGKRLSELIALLQDSYKKFIVDFNGSLSAKELDSFWIT